jgi:hypothetical protein
MNRREIIIGIAATVAAAATVGVPITDGGFDLVPQPVEIKISLSAEQATEWLVSEFERAADSLIREKNGLVRASEIRDAIIAVMPEQVISFAIETNLPWEHNRYDYHVEVS